MISLSLYSSRTIFQISSIFVLLGNLSKCRWHGSPRPFLSIKSYFLALHLIRRDEGARWFSIRDEELSNVLAFMYPLLSTLRIGSPAGTSFFLYWRLANAYIQQAATPGHRRIRGVRVGVEIVLWQDRSKSLTRPRASSQQCQWLKDASHGPAGWEKWPFPAMNLLFTPLLQEYTKWKRPDHVKLN
jgi:hypothetical protein